jgi:hypothetical protein
LKRRRRRRSSPTFENVSECYSGCNNLGLTHRSSWAVERLSQTSAREEIGQNLQRDIAIELCVVGAIDRAHPAFADLGGDFVDAKTGAGNEGQGLRDYTGGTAVRTGLFLNGAVFRNSRPTRTSGPNRRWLRVQIRGPFPRLSLEARSMAACRSAASAACWGARASNRHQDRVGGLPV